MTFHVMDNTIVYKVDGKVLAEVSYPPVGIGTVDICKTHVDESLRGQGIASQLMERTANELRKTKRKAIATCSYAIKWFEQNPDYNDLLK